MAKIKKKKIQYKRKPDTDTGAKKIVNVLRQHKVCMVNINTGGGKTFMSIRAIQAISHHAFLLILTTKKIKDEESWNQSINSYNQTVTNADLKYAVFNYDQINYPNGQKLLKASLSKFKDRTMYVVVDEAQYIKNATSNNFKHVKQLANLPFCKRVVFLSATPISESLLDTRAFLILDGYYRNQTDFYKQHVIMRDKHFQPIVKDFNNVIHNEWLKDYETIIERFKEIQVTKDTESLLPDLIYKEMVFSYDKATQKAYRKIAKAYRDGVYDSIATANADQRTFIAEHAEQRLTMLNKILHNPKRPQGPVLIFYQYNADREMLREYLTNQCPEYKLLELSGHQHFDTKITPPDNAVIICQYQAASEGLNAKWSHLTIFYSPTYSWAKFKQAQGRNRRAYQGGTTYQIRFVVLKTINEHYWYDLIDNKKKFTENLAEQYLNEDI